MCSPATSNGKAETIAKWSAICLAIIYTCGLLIDNINLSRYGIFERDLVRVQYAATGFCFLFFLIAPGLIFIIPAGIGALWTGKQNCLAFLGKSAVLVGIGLWFVRIFAHVFAEGREHWFHDSVGLYSATLFLFPVILLFIYLPIALFCLGSRDAWSTALVTVAVSVGVLATMMVYARDIHINIDKTFGGARPRIANLLLSPEGIRCANGYGIQSDTNSTIHQVMLIHENSDAFFFRVRVGGYKPQWEQPKNLGTRSYRFSKSCVVGVQYLVDKIHNVF
jgi:hypothetical protein